MVMLPIIFVMAVSFSARNGASAALETAGPAANTAQGTTLRKVRAMAATTERVIERALEGMAHIPVAIRSMQSTPE